MIWRSCGGPGGRVALAAALVVGASGCGPRSDTKTVLQVEGGSDSEVRYSDRPALPPPPKIGTDVADGEYLSAVAEQIQPAWASFLEDCRSRLPGSHPLNVPTLVTEVDLVLNSAGEVLSVQSTKGSGNEEFDQVALEIAADIQQLPKPPVQQISDDERVYLHWSFARDVRQAGPATASWKRVELPIAQALPKLLTGAQFAAATQRVLDSKSPPADAAALLRLVAGAVVGAALGQSDPNLQAIALHSVGSAELTEYLPQVREAVRSTESQVSVAAMRALASVGGKSDLELLASYAQGALGTAPEASAAAALSLHRLGRGEATAERAIEQLASDSEPARISALSVLSVLPAAASVAPLSAFVLGTARATREERTAAATALGRQGATSPQAVKTLLACAGTGDASLRTACIAAITTAARTGMRSRVAYWKIQERLKDKDERVRGAAILAAAALDPARFANELKGLRAGGSMLVLRSMAEAFGSVPGPVSLARLLDLAAAPDEGLRIWAARGLAGRQEAEAGEALARLAGDASASVRVAAVAGLADDAQLQAHLSDDSPLVQARAFAILTKRQGRETMAPLLAATLANAELAPLSGLLWVDAWLTSGQ